MSTATPPPVEIVDDPLKRLPTDADLARDPVAALASLPTDKDLPSSDGVPMDSPWHRAAMNLLIETLERHWMGRKDFYVGGDMFLYFSTEHVFNKDFRGPDFFVVLGADHDRPRDSWVVWQEGGRTPDVIVELASASTVAKDRGPKKELYANTFRTSEYYIFDPAGGRLEGWRRTADGRYGPLLTPDALGRLWSEQLQLAIGPWDGEFQGHSGRWPRFFTADGTVVSTYAEASVVEKQRADTETQRAENEKQRADAAEQEVVRLRAMMADLTKRQS